MRDGRSLARTWSLRLRRGPALRRRWLRRRRRTPPRWRRSPPRHGMVVTAQHLATEVGVDVLQARRQRGRRRGRGRLRAGGGLPGRRQSRRRRLHDASSSPTAARPSSISARRRRSPRPRDMYLDADGNVDQGREHRAAISRSACPARSSGLETALAKYGTMKRADADRAGDRAAPSEGFVLDQGDADMLATATDAFKADPATARDLPATDGEPYSAGDRLVQKDLAATLRADRARRRRTASTRGRSARAIVASSQRRQGPHHRRPTSTSTRPRELRAGRVRLPRLPRRLGAAAELGRRRHLRDPQHPRGLSAEGLGFRSAQAVHVQIEAMRHAYVDRNSYLGDPDFVKNPLDRLLDKAYAAKIRAAIDPAQGRRLAGPQARRRAARGQQHDALLDRRRARATPSSVTYTLNDWFGAKRHRRRAPASCSTTRWTTSPSKPGVAEHLRPGAGRGQRDRARASGRSRR